MSERNVNTISEGEFLSDKNMFSEEVEVTSKRED